MNDRWGCCNPVKESLHDIDDELNQRLMSSRHFRTLLPQYDHYETMDAEERLANTLESVQSSGARIPRRLKRSNANINGSNGSAVAENEELVQEENVQTEPSGNTTQNNEPNW